jgi:hypothetical protein
VLCFWVSLSSRREARVSCLFVFPCACAALRLICRFASASPPSRPAALRSIFVRAILVLRGAHPNGPLGKGCSRHCAPVSTRNDNCQFIEVSPVPLHCIVHGGRPLDVCSPLGRRPCVGTYCITERKSVLFRRQLFQ